MLAARWSGRSPTLATSCAAPGSPPINAGLAGAGALNALAGHRRSALWDGRGVPRRRRAFPGRRRTGEGDLVALERMTLSRRLQRLYHLSLTTGHPMGMARPMLPGMRTAAQLRDARPGERSASAARHHPPAPGNREGFCFHSRSRTRRGLRTRSSAAPLRGVAPGDQLEPALVVTGLLQTSRG